MTIRERDERSGINLIRASAAAAVLALFFSTIATTQTGASPCVSSVPYGNNPGVGHFAAVNGIQLYYEIYGSGPVLLVMHGNRQSIARMGCQIAFFAPAHTVLAVDSRGAGKSGDGRGPLTFEQQADDFNALLEHEHIDKADLLGSSNGGILALMMGIRHPDKVRRIVAVAPNLRPDDTALTASTIARLRATLADAVAKRAAGDQSQDWAKVRRDVEFVLNEPHISLDQVHSIASPTLLIGADQDEILPEHYLEIYKALPHAELFIIPGTIHSGLIGSPMFNPAVAAFLDGPLPR